MKEKKAFHKEKISQHHRVQKQKQENLLVVEKSTRITLPDSNIDDVNDTFKEVVQPKKRRMDVLYQKNKKQKIKDINYIPYAPSDQHTEEG